MTHKTKEKEPELFGHSAPKVDPKPGSAARKKTAVAEVKPKAKAASTAVAVRAPEPMEASSANLMMMVAQIARDPQSDPKKMESVLNVITAIRAEEDRRAFTSAMLKMKPLLPEIDADNKIVVKEKNRATGERDGKVIQSTPYATYPNIHRIVTPILTSHGFVYDSWIEPGADGRVNVVGQLDHVGGHFRRSVFPLPAETSGSKNNVQGWGSAASFGKRYNIILLLDLVTRYEPDSDRNGYAPSRGREVRNEQDDVGADGPRTQKLSEEDIETLRAKIEACGVSEAEFCRFYEIDRVEDLPADKLEEAENNCLEYGKRRKSKG